MNLEEIRERIGREWEIRADGWWKTIPLDRVRAAALDQKHAGSRFAALTVRPRDGRLDLMWHWDLSGLLLTVLASIAPDEPVPSLVDLWPGADWAEREARDYYAVTFSGRPGGTPPLMLRDGDAPGVLLPGKDGEPQ